MPSKAAQVFGTSERKPNRVVVRPIKPASSFVTPSTVPHSDTSKSLPGKLVDPHSNVRRRHSGAYRRNRAGRRSSGRGSKQSSDVESTPPLPKIITPYESISPPTPPAKDTPPNHRPADLPPSPLRRAHPSEDLRESYGANVGNGMKLQFPQFALSPSLSQSAVPNHGGTSPTKALPYTAEDYKKLIQGEALQWRYPDVSDVSSEKEGSRNAPPAAENVKALQLPHPNRQSNGLHDNNRNSSQLSPLPPRFYSPSNRSAHSFAEGETPSKNVSAPSLLSFTCEADLAPSITPP